MAIERNWICVALKGNFFFIMLYRWSSPTVCAPPQTATMEPATGFNQQDHNDIWQKKLLFIWQETEAIWPVGVNLGITSLPFPVPQFLSPAQANAKQQEEQPVGLVPLPLGFAVSSGLHCKTDMISNYSSTITFFIKNFGVCCVFRSSMKTLQSGNHFAHLINLFMWSCGLSFLAFIQCCMLKN